MKHTKRLISLALVLVLVFALAACGNTDTPATTDPVVTDAPVEYKGETIKVAAIKGPTGMGMVHMMSNDTYAFTLTSDPTEVATLLATGKVDIAACPLNLAANLYKKTGGGVQMLAINTLGVLYLLTNGETINNVADLKGKTIYATGQGATPEQLSQETQNMEYILADLLAANGLSDVKVEYLSEHSELAAKISSGDCKIAVLPEPFVTVATNKNSAVTVALSLTDLWNEAHPDSRLAQGCVVARKSFIDSNPDGVKAFLQDARSSVEQVNTDALTASTKMVEQQIVDEALFSIPADTAEKKQDATKTQKANDVIGRCNIVFIEGAQMQQIADENFKVLFAADPTSVGGELPAAALYYGA